MRHGVYQERKSLPTKRDLLLFMAILTQALFTLVSGDLMTLSFFTAGHNTNKGFGEKKGWFVFKKFGGKRLHHG